LINSKIRLLPSCLIALAIGSPAWANDGNDVSRLLALSLEDLINTPVVTASRQAETRSQSPAHIMVITREQIRQRRYHNLADLMQDLPGVDFMRGTKSSAFNNFTVQGYAGSNKMLVMLDGVRIGHPAGGTFPIAENFSLYLAKQVEILYGPAAALYGADAVAGVINIISDRAADAPTATVMLEGGSFDSRNASFLASVSNENKLALSVGGHRQSSDRAPLHKYYPAEFEKVDAGAIPAAEREDYVGNIESHSLFARLDVGDDLSFGYYRNHFRSLTSTGDTPATALYREDAFWDTTTDTLYGKYRFKLAENLGGELVVDYSVQEIDPDSKYININTGFANSYEYAHGERLSIEQNLNWQLNPNHRILAGVGYQDYSAIEGHSLSRPYDTGRGPDDQSMFYRNTTLPIRIYDADFDNLSLYSQWQAQWLPEFSTMAGIRHDRHSYFGSSNNMRLGAIWNPRNDHFLKLLYGEAFRAPSPEEGLSSFGSFTWDAANEIYRSNRGFRLPNFELDPETAKTLSLTWDWRPRPELNLIANAYDSRIEGLIITQPNLPDDSSSLPGAILVGPRMKGNAGWQEQCGLDLIAQYRFPLGATWSGDVWGSVSWIKGRIDEGRGEWEIPLVSQHKAKLGATFKYLDRFSITPRLLHIGDARNERRGTAAPDRLTTPGYTVADLHLGWHKLLDGKASVWLDIYNLFDKRYYSAAGAGTFIDMPQAPRSGMLALEYSF
jgi:outer membrane receptor for ferrienterochelin and colicins